MGCKMKSIIDFHEAHWKHNKILGAQNKIDHLTWVQEQEGEQRAQVK